MNFNSFFKTFSEFDAYQVNLSLLSFSALKAEYSNLLIYIIIAAILGLIIVVLSYLLVTQSPESEKLSTYECGFEPYEDSRNRFNIRFYTIAILFLLFDIEIIFMLPWCLHLSQLNILSFWSMIEFLVELGIGYIYIWVVGAIEWK